MKAQSWCFPARAYRSQSGLNGWLSYSQHVWSVRICANASLSGPPVLAYSRETTAGAPAAYARSHCGGWGAASRSKRGARHFWRTLLEGLRRHVAAELRVPCAIHFAHPARAERRDDFVRPQLASRHKVHGFLNKASQWATSRWAKTPAGAMPPYFNPLARYRSERATS